MNFKNEDIIFTEDSNNKKFILAYGDKLNYKFSCKSTDDYLIILANRNIPIELVIKEFISSFEKALKQ